MKENNYINYIIYSCLLFVIVSCSQKKINETTLPPDSGQRLAAKHAMVSSAHPLASDIGAAIMKKGGNAIDAAVATAFAVSVTEPEMSGLGGGGSMVLWLNDKKEAVYIDFYTAKRVATYQNLPEDIPEHNLLEIGIPGEVAGLLYAQKKYGKLTRQEVMQPAIDLARDGFSMYKTLVYKIKENKKKLNRHEAGSKFLPDGKTFPVGKIFRQPILAKTLEAIAANGRSAFYNSEITDDIIEVMNEGGNPVSRVDFQNYKVRVNKKPLAGTYHNWIVLSAAPPQTGMEIIETLNLLEPFNLKKIGLPTKSDSSFHLLTAALRAGKADRGKYINDPNWGWVPSAILTSKKFAKERAKSVFVKPVPHRMKAGNVDAFKQGGKRDVGVHSETTSLSVIDPSGNAVALTQTNSQAFGSGAWVRGFFLNDSGINLRRVKPDSSFEPKNDYRVRSSTIAPTIILNQDSTVKMVIGAPGGGHIPTDIVQNIVYMLDYSMDPMASLRMPRIYPHYGSRWVEVENGFSGHVLNSARKNGYWFNRTFHEYTARIYVIEKKNGYWVGAADPHHEGGVAGY